MKPLRVLVVDDSRIFRHALESVLGEIGECQVVGSEFNGARALAFLQSTPVDVVTLDVEMPAMDGLDVLRAIEANEWQHPKPAVIMVSAHTRRGAETTIEALNHGAIGFVTKPSAQDRATAHHLLKSDLATALAAVRVRGKRSAAYLRGTSAFKRQAVLDPGQRPDQGLVLIASSTGGPQALNRLLPDLCEQIEVPIAIVQHMPPLFTASLAATLDRRCSQYAVREAEDGAPLVAHEMVVAPGGRHLRIVADRGLRCRLDDGPPVHGCRPSADVLFASLSACRAAPAVAVVLTGMGADGSTALPALKSQGVTILAQDEATSVVWGMPGKAVETGCVDRILPLERIGEGIADALRVRP